MGEFVRGQFADQQRAGGAEPCNDCGVAIGDMVARRARTACRRDARRLEDILRPVGNPVHRTPVAARHDFLFGNEGLAAGVVDGRCNERVDLRFDVRDALRKDVDVLDGR